MKKHNNIEIVSNLTSIEEKNNQIRSNLLSSSVPNTVAPKVNTPNKKNVTVKRSNQEKEFDKLKQKRLLKIQDQIEEKYLEDQRLISEEVNESRIHRSILHDYILAYDNEKIDEHSVFIESQDGIILSADVKVILTELLNINSVKVIYFGFSNENILQVNSILTNEKIMVVKKNSRNYYKAQSKSKFLISDSGFGPHFIKKEEQIYLNLDNTLLNSWNGKDIVTQFGKYASKQKNYLMSDIIISSSDKLFNKFKNAYDLENMWNGKMIKSIPRFEIPFIAEDMPPVLFEVGYCFTKTEFLQQISIFEDLINDLEDVEFKINIDRKNLTWLPKEIGEYLVSPHLDKISLLRNISTMITCNSDLIYDAAYLGKSIINYLNLPETYYLERNSYINPEDLPGLVIYDYSSLVNSIKDVKKQDHSQFNERAFELDKSASELIFEFLNYEKRSPSNKNILVYLGDLTNNGIYKSFLNSISHYDKNLYKFIIVTKPNSKNEWSNEEIRNAYALPENVSIMFREGAHNYLFEERNTLLDYTSGESNEFSMVKNIYKREFDRLFGYLDLSSVIDFNGFVPYWSSLFASYDGKKAILLHTDMKQEYFKIEKDNQVNQQKLNTIFSVYSEYDQIISRNVELSEINQHNLQNLYGDAEVTNLGVLNNFAKRSISIASSYVNFYNELIVEEKVILFESFHGKSMVGDPLAIFKYMLDDEQFKEYQFVWSLNNLENVIDNSLLHDERVTFVSVGSYLYKRYLTVAKVIINNTTLPPYYVKQKDQIYVNTWHGTPYKTLGKDMKGPIGTQANIVSNFLKADYHLFACDYTKEKMIGSHDIEGLWNGQGFYSTPRIDLMKEDLIIKNYLENDLAVDFEQETILYCPTWKGNLNEIGSDFAKLIDEFKLLKKELPDKNILLKVHSLMYSRMSDEEKKSVVNDKYDMNQIMYYVDTLVTDFSSSFFDFAVLNRKIVHYLDGIDKYEETRGLYLAEEKLPGTRVHNILQLITELKKDYQNEDYCEFNQIYNQQKTSTKELVNSILKKPQIRENSKINVLIYAGGFLNNGITKSIINLSNELDYSKYNLIVIDKNEYDAESTNNICKLNKQTKVIYRSGSIIQNHEEHIAYNQYLEDKPAQIPEVIRNLMRRELNRMIGDTKIDVFLDFSGYVNFWTLIFASAAEGKKLIYQHNNMHLEYYKVVEGTRVHEEKLDHVFNLYKEFDKVIAVSKETMEINYSYLNEFYDKTQAMYIENIIDYKEINEKLQNLTTNDFEIIQLIRNKTDINLKLQHAKEQNELLDYFDISHVNIDEVTYIKPLYLGYFGRISPEKGQIDFIKKLPDIIKEIPNLVVVFCGNGPQYDEAIDLVDTLQLTENVIFTGHISNPFIFMNIFDIVALFSYSEGQPMVLLEALTVGANVIASDIPGNRSVLGTKYGKIVGFDVSSIIDGIKNYSQKEKFDVIEYNKMIVEKYKKILN